MSGKNAGLGLNEQLAVAGLAPLEDLLKHRFETYFSLFSHWNNRLNLSAVRDEKGFLSRHLVESITVARALPSGIATLLDFGSGAGLPGIPIALCRPEVVVTLAESQNKKAAFLQEAVRVLRIHAIVSAGRAEALQQVFDCVTLRAVDKMSRAVTAAVRMVAPNGWLALMTTEKELNGLQVAAAATFSWTAPLRLPNSDSRLLALGQRVSS